MDQSLVEEIDEEFDGLRHPTERPARHYPNRKPVTDAFLGDMTFFATQDSYVFCEVYFCEASRHLDHGPGEVLMDTEGYYWRNGEEKTGCLFKKGDEFIVVDDGPGRKVYRMKHMVSQRLTPTASQFATDKNSDVGITVQMATP